MSSRFINVLIGPDAQEFMVIIDELRNTYISRRDRIIEGSGSPMRASQLKHESAPEHSSILHRSEPRHDTPVPNKRRELIDLSDDFSK